MKIATSFSISAFVLGLAAFAGASAMQAPKDQRPAPPAVKPEAKPDQHQHDMDPALTKPGPVHQFLAKYVGNYTTSVTMTMGGQAMGEPVVGTSKITSMLGGRFFLDENTGTMEGQPYTSMHYTGYNNATKQFESSWSWTNDTGMLYLTGTSPDGGRTINWKTEFVGPDGTKQKLTIETRHKDDDHFSIVMRGGGGDTGEPEVVMTTEYTRKK